MRVEVGRPVIYVVDGSVALTGAFVCARSMARALAGLVDIVLVLPQESAISETELSDFRAVHYLPIMNLRKSVRAVLLYLPRLVIASWRIRRLMRSDGADSLVLNDFYLMHGALCRLLGFKGRVMAWVRIDPRRFGRILSYVWLQLLAATSDEVVSVSRFIQGTLPSRMRTTLLYDVLDRVPLSVVPSVGQRRLVFVGNYIQGKGQDEAIEAFAAVALEHFDLSLEFYGGVMGLEKNRAWLDQLRRRVVELRLVDRIRFKEFVSDPRTVLAGAYAALNFSASESFSMTVLEASGAGLPVIATRSGGPEEIVEDGVTGILVPVGDIEAMAAAIRKLISNPGLAAAMGRAGSVRVAQRFAPEAFRADLMSVLAFASKP